jgi:hypothetical protein
MDGARLAWTRGGLEQGPERGVHFCARLRLINCLSVFFCNPVTAKVVRGDGALAIALPAWERAFKIIPKASIELPGASKGLPSPSENFSPFPGI